MRLMLACIALIMTVGTTSATTLTECGESEGYTYYFSGGVVSPDKAGFRDDRVGGGSIILNYSNNEFDLLFKDDTGSTTSVKGRNANLQVLPATNSLISVMVLYAAGGAVEHYVFQLDDRGDGALVWTAVSPANVTLNRASLMSAQCRGPR